MYYIRTTQQVTKGRYNMNLIACVNKNWAIGYNGNLLYHIPKDMDYFKSKTMNKTVIMGKNTYQSLKIKPLPNRLNIVLSSSLQSSDNNTLICNNIQKLYDTILNIPHENIFIIGGEKVYKTFIDKCSTAYITKVYDTCISDTFFPSNLDMNYNWKLVEESQIFKYKNLEYSFNVYKKK